MISREDLQHSISEARAKAQDLRGRGDRGAGSARRSRARAERLVGRACSTAGLERMTNCGRLATEPMANAKANGTGRNATSQPSPMRTALLAAVIDILTESWRTDAGRRPHGSLQERASRFREVANRPM